MGFANLSIAEIAADYNTSVSEVLQLCDRLGISYRNAQTRLALEDAKAIISEIMAQRNPSETNRQEDSFLEANQNSVSEASYRDPSISTGPERSGKP